MDKEEWLRSVPEANVADLGKPMRGKKVCRERSVGKRHTKRLHSNRPPTIDRLTIIGNGG